MQGGNIYVVKLGGEIMLNATGLDALAIDIAGLARDGVGIVVVHGGGPQADALAEKLGHKVRKVAGRRVTDDDALEVAKMVYGGSINAEILAALLRHGARGVGLSGIDAGLITVGKRPPVKVRDPETGKEETVDFGHVGDIQEVDVALLRLLLENGYVPVVASLAADTRGPHLQRERRHDSPGSRGEAGSRRALSPHERAWHPPRCLRSSLADPHLHAGRYKHPD